MERVVEGEAKIGRKRGREGSKGIWEEAKGS